MAILGLAVILSACSLIAPGDNQSGTNTTPEPDLVGTAKALSTRIAENASYVQTAQVEATQRALGPTPMVTPTPFEFPLNLTPGAPTSEGTPGSPASPTDPAGLPADLPLVPGEKEDIFVSLNLISYLTSMTYQDVVNFYDQAMPEQGWTKSARESFATENSALLKFNKGIRTTSITIQRNPISNLTAVVITIKG